MLYRQHAAMRGRWGPCGKGKEQKGQVFRKRRFNQDPKEKKRSQLHVCLGLSIPGTGNSEDKCSEQESAWCACVRERKREKEEMVSMVAPAMRTGS